jgi:hypothetical protein
MRSPLAVSKPGAFVYLVAACVAAIVVAQAVTVSAFTAHGHVVNGTTGEGHHPATVRIVNPSSMMVEHEVRTNDPDGSFVAEGLDESVGVYLLRVEYDGVNYTEFVQPAAGDVTTRIVVYEKTTSWDGVSVVLPHFVAARTLDTLQVDRFYTVTNASSPPKTVSGDDARFTFAMPADILAIGNIYVMSLGMPIPVDPVPTTEPHVYAIDYSIKPGDTQIAVSVLLPYGGGSYTYREQPRYALDQFTVLTADPAMDVTLNDGPLNRGEDSHGFATYDIGAVAAGTEIALTFRGGAGGGSAASSGGAAAAHSGGSPQVVVIPNRTNVPSLALMGGVFFVMLALVAFAAGRGSTGVADAAIEQRRDNLLSQMARLDDLHRAGTVTDRLYEMKRNELRDALAQIYYRTRFHRGGVGD